MSDAPILICYDGSDEAAEMIEGAAEVLGPRRAIVLAVEPTLTLSESFASIFSGVPGTELEDLNGSEALAHARAGVELARKAGFTADARGTVAPETWTGIVDVADEIGASVIVVGSRGLNAVREAFERSVSHDVARHSHRPVLVVPDRRKS